MKPEENQIRGNNPVPTGSTSEQNPSNGGGSSSYTQNIGRQQIESLEVSSEGSSNPIKNTFYKTSALTSLRGNAAGSRKVFMVSVSIVLVVIAFIALLVGLVFRGPDTSLTNGTDKLKTSDVQLEDINSDLSLFDNEQPSLLVNGDLITKGSLKVVSGGFTTTFNVDNPTDDQTITFPNQSGSICLDSNNCAYSTQADIDALAASVNDQLANLNIPASGVESINQIDGNVTLQGTTNRITVNKNGKTITFSTPQDLALTSSPTFSSLVLNNNFTVNGIIRTNLNCTTFQNGGSLSTDTSGNLICTDDELSGGGTSVTSPGGTIGSIPVYIAADQIADSIISQSGAVITITGGLSVTTTATVTGLTTLNGGLTVEAGDTFTFNSDAFTDLTGNGLQVTANALTIRVQANKGLEVDGNGLSLVDCLDGEVLKYETTGGTWGCSTDIGSGGLGDDISVNGTSATDANFIDTAASGTTAGVAFTLNTVSTPDDISLVISTASGTQAGVITTGSQTLAGTKTFNGQIVAGGGIDLGTQTLQGTTAVINFNNFDVDASGNGDFAGTLTAGTANAFQVSATGVITYVNGATNTDSVACRNSSGELAACNSTFATTTDLGSYVQLQSGTPGSQETGHINISGTGIFGTALLTPNLDTATATGLAIGGTNATSVTITPNTTISGSATVTGLTTLNGGLTVEAGDTFTFNSDAFTDLTGNGLQVTANALTIRVQANKGLEVDGNGLSLVDCLDGEVLKYETTGGTWGCSTDIGSGGLGDDISVNGTSATDANFIDTAASGTTAGVAFTLNTVSTPDDISLVISTASGTQAGVITTGSQTLAGTKTFNGQIVAGGGIDLGTQTLQGTTAVINFNNFDVDASGNGDFAGTLTAGTANAFQVSATGVITYVNGATNTDSVACRNSSGELAACNSTFATTTDLGSYVQLQSGTPGSQETGNINISGTGIFGTALLTPNLDTATATGLAIGGTNATSVTITPNTTISGSATVTGLTTLNGGLTVEAGDTFTFNSDAFTDLTGNGLQVTANALTIRVQANKGLEVDGNGLSLVDCLDGEVLKYETTGGTWGCSTDIGSGGLGDDISVNGTSATDANFIDTAASGTTAGVAFTLNTVSTPDDISLVISTASGTQAGVITTGSQTLAGTKTFNGQIVAGGGIDLGTQTLQGTTAVINFNNFDVDASGNGDFAGTLTAGTANAFQVSATGVITYVNGATNTDSVACRNSSGELAACNSTFATTTDLGSYVQLQSGTPGSQETGHINISGTGIFGTALLTPNLDTATATGLAIGGTNATSVTITPNTTISGSATVTGLTTLNGGLTVEAGDTFTFNSDAFTDLTGNGLQVTANALTIRVQANKGLEVDGNGLSLVDCLDGEVLKYETTGGTWGCSTDIGSGGLGDDISVNGTSATDANFIDTAASGTTAGVAFTLNTVSTPDDISLVISTASGTQAGVITTGSQTLAGTKTFNGQIVAGGGIDLGTQTLQGTTAVINFNNFDVDASGNGDFAGTLTAGTANAFQVSATGVITYVNGATNTDSVACRNSSGELAACNSTFATTTDLGSYVQLQSGTPGSQETGHINISGTGIFGTALLTPNLDTATATGLAIGGTNATSVTITPNTTISGSATVTGLTTLNGGLTVEAGDTFTFNSDAFTDLTGNGLQVTANALTIRVQANKGLEVDGNGLSLVDCLDGEVLKYETTGGTWGCSTDIGSGGLGDDISVNGTSATDANFIDTAASGTTAGVAFTLNTVSTPDDISLVISTASGTQAGVITTGSQTLAGTKTFNGQIVAGGGIDLGTQTLQGTTAVINFNNFDVDASGNGDFAGTLTAGTANAFQVSATGVITYVNGATNTDSVACRNSSGELAACNSTFATTTDLGSYVQLQSGTPGSQETGNINISGTGIFGTALLTPNLDTATATGLAIGGTNATSVTITPNTTISGSATVTGLTTLNGGLTVEAGDTFTFNSDAFTDLTGNGLQVTANALTIRVQANKGLEVDGNGLSLVDCLDGEVLKYETTGGTWGCSTDIGSGGLGDDISVNGTSATDANFIDTAASGTTAGVAFTLNTVSTPDDISLVISTASGTQAGVITTGSQTLAGTKTFNGQIVAGGGIDLGTQTLQGTTAVINFNNFDVDASGNGDFAGTLTAGTANAFQVSATGVITYVNGATNTDSVACRNSSGELAACNSTFATTTDLGSYVQLQSGTPGSQETGNINISGTGIFGTALLTPNLDTATATGLAIGGTNATSVTITPNTTISGSATVTGLTTLNGGLTVEAGDTFTFNSDAFTDLTGNGLQVTANALTIRVQANKGLEVDGNGLSLVDCLDGEVLKYETTGGTWGCAADAGAGGTGDDISVNGSAATNANFLNTTASASVAGTTWALNTASSPDDITLVVSDASATLAGIVTANAQTFGGAKTFNGSVTVQGLATLGVASTTNGALVFLNGTNAFGLTLNGANQTTGSATVSFPDTAGANDTICLVTLSNCTGAGTGGASASEAYLTIGNTAGLSDERAIAVNSTNLTATDGGANGSYTINTIQDIASTSAPTFASLNTGQGANELYAMNQAVQTSDNVTFNSLTLTTALTVANGGTGATTLTNGGILIGNGTGAISATSVLTNGQLLIGDGTGAPTLANLTAGTGITITNGAGSITIDNTVVDTNTTYTAGNDLDLTGTTFDIESQLDFVSTISRASSNLTLQTTTTGDILLTPAGNARLTSGDLILDSASSELRILESAGGAFYGQLDVGDLTADRTYTFPNVDGAVSILGQTIENGELANSSVNYGGVTVSLGGSDTTPAFNLIDSTGLPIGAGTTGTLAVDRGGTGAASFTLNRLLLGNGTSALQETNAATSGQVLIGSAGGVPTFQSFSGDVFVSNTGVTTIQANSVALGTDTTGNYVATITAGAGLTGDATTEGSTPTLAVGAGNGITVNANDITLAVQASKGLEVDGNGLSLVDCADGQILKYTTTGNVWACSADVDTNTTYTAGNDLDLTGTTFDIESQLDFVSTISRASSNLTLQTTTTGDILLTPAGNARLTSGDLILDSASSELRILESAGGAFYGQLDVGDLTADRTYTFPNVDGAVSILGQTIENGELANSSVNYGGVTVSLGGSDTTPAFNLIDSTGLPIGAGTTGTLAVDRGGTGAASFTLNRLLLGNGTSALQETNAATSGQVLIGSAGGVPTFQSFSGDVFVSNTGVTTIQANSVALGTDTTGNYVATITAGAGLTGDATTEGSTPTLAVGAGNGITVNANDITLAVQASKGLEVDGNGLSLVDCADGQILKYTTTGNVWACSADVDTNTTYTAGNDLDLTGTTFDIESQLDFVSTISRASSNLTLQTTTTGDILLTPAGNARLTSGDLILDSASSELRILESAGGAFYGQLDVGDLTADRTYTFPNVDGAVSILGQTIENGELANSSVNYGGVTVSLGGSDTTPAFNLIDSTGLPIGAGTTGTLAVDRGGTGAASFTLNRLLLGNGTSALQETNAATSGQVLIGSAGGVPTFQSFSGDVFVSNTGVTTIQANSVALGTDTTGNYVATITAGAGLTGDATTEGSTPTLAVGAGNGITVNANDITLAVQASKGLEVDGNGLSLVDCADGQILKYTTTGNVWACSADVDTNTTYTAGNDLDLTGTTFDIESQLDFVSTISRASSNLTLQTTTTGDILLTPAGNARLTSGDLILDSASSELRILESAGGAFYGQLDVGDLTADRTYTFPNVDGAVSILGQTIENGELANSSVNYGGVTVSLGGSDTTPAFNLIDSTGLPIGAGTTGTLAVDRGGTGAASFTLNRLLLGNGTSALQETNAATSGQVLIGSAGGVPTFQSFSGDVFVSNTGVTTIQANSVALGTDTTGNYVATITAGAGLTGDATTEGSTPTLAVGAGNGITVNANDITLAVQASKGLEVDGNGLSLVDCADGQILKYTTTGNVWACSADVDTNTTYTAGNDIDFSSGTQIDLEPTLNFVTTITRASSDLTLQTTTTGNIVLDAAGTIELEANTNITGALVATGNGTFQGGSLTLGTTTQAGSLVVHDGNGGQTATIQLGNIAANTILTMPSTLGATDTFCFVTLNNCVGSGSTSVGALDGGTPNANGGNISAGILYLQSATDSLPGLVNTTTQTFAGAKTFNGSVTVAASQSLRLVGGNTASRPGSPTEGMVYFDTTTKTLLTYSNGKWQATTGEYIIVAASDSTQAEKDAAHYVADGEIGDKQATLDGDQVEINAALTAAAGGKVYLAPGLYRTDATILIPNNTTLTGAGFGTRVELADIDVTDNFIENLDTATGTGVVVRDMEINGRRDLNTVGTQHGIYFNGMGDGLGNVARAGGAVYSVRTDNFAGTSIYLNNSDNSIISNNFILGDAPNTGIRSVGSYNLTITSNLIKGNGQSGIVFDTTTNSTVTGNNLEDNSSYNIYIATNSDKNTISGNNIDDGTYGIGVVSSSYNNVTGNNLSGNMWGIYTSVAHNSTISSNNLTSSSQRGLNINNTDDSLISGNNIYDSGGTTTNNGIYIGGSNRNLISNNSIRDTSCTSNCFAILINSGTNNYLESNFYSGTAGNNATISDGGTTTIYAGQSRSANSNTAVATDFLFRSGNTAQAFQVQNASGASLFTVDSTNSAVAVGNTTVAGNLVIHDGNGGQTATIQLGNIAANTVLTMPSTLGATDTFCFVTLNNCATTAATSVGAIDGGTPDGNGAQISAGVLYLQYATDTLPGLVSTSAQTFAGAKTFTGGASVRGLTVDTATATDDRILTTVTPGGAGRFDGTITSTDLTAARTWTLPNASGTFCLSGQTCATSGTVGYWSRTGTTLSQSTANDILSLTANVTDVLTVSTSATTANNKALVVSNTGATVGTDYGLYLTNTGAATTNVGLYASATGATNNYAAIFENGNVGIGTVAPSSKLAVRSTDINTVQITIEANSGQVSDIFQAFGPTAGGVQKLTWINEKGELRTRAAAINSVGLKVRDYSDSQTANLLEIDRQVGGTHTFFNNQGYLAIGRTLSGTTISSALDIDVNADGDKGIQITGNSPTQSGNFINIRDSGLTQLFQVTSNGDTIMQSKVNSLTALQVKRNGTDLVNLQVDTINQRTIFSKGSSIYTPANLDANVMGAYINNTGGSTNSAMAIISGNTTGVSSIYFGDDNSSTIGQVNYDNSDNSLRISTNSTEKFTILSGGQVGIGDTTPDAQLDIETMSAATVGLIVQGSASHAANMVEIRNDTAGAAGQLVVVEHDGKTTFRNDTNSTAGFSVQNSSSQNILGVDTSNGRLNIGQGSTLTASLILHNSTNANTVGLTVGATSSSYTLTLPSVLGATGSCLKQSNGTGTLTFGVCGASKDTIIPEYPGGVLTADGTNNTGTMTSDFCSGTSRKSVNTAICAATEERNYYSWTSASGNNDYDIYVRYQLRFATTAASSTFNVLGWRTDATTNDVNVSVFNAAGAQCGTTTNVATGTAAWTETAVAGVSADGDCNMAQGDIIVIRIQMNASASDFVRVGDIRIDY